MEPASISSSALPLRLKNALTAAGITSVEELVGKTRAELSSMPGIGSTTMLVIEATFGHFWPRANSDWPRHPLNPYYGLIQRYAALSQKARQSVRNLIDVLYEAEVSK